MWYFVGAVLILLYLSMFPLMWYELNKHSPYWNAKKYWHLVKTYWAWPALALYVAGMVLWKLWPDIKARYFTRNKE